MLYDVMENVLLLVRRLYMGIVISPIEKYWLDDIVRLNYIFNLCLHYV